MTLTQRIGMVGVVGVALLAAACGPKKKAVTEADFKATSSYLYEKMNGSKFTLDAKKKYVLSQLGKEHRAEGKALYWYTAPASCNFFEFDMSSGNGSDSWGTAQTPDCEKWAPK